MEGERGEPPEQAAELPKAVLDFFSSGEPRLLVVSGRPRVGKTIFVLGLAGCIAPPRERHILLTKRLEQEVLEAHPWVRDALEREETGEARATAVAGSMPNGTPEDVGEPPRMKSARELLDKILEELSAGSQLDTALEKAVGEGEIATPGAERARSPASPPPDMSGVKKVLGEKEVPELERLFRSIDASGGRRGVAIVDRIDRLAEKYGTSPAGLCRALKEEIVGRRRIHLIVVPEKTGSELEGLADAVVRLKDVSQGDEFLGQLELWGSVGSKKTRCMYALRGGRFMTLKGIDTWS
ncbi:MAG: hypothetical protein QW379_07795 [Thermoplasmata archaeon]